MIGESKLSCHHEPITCQEHNSRTSSAAIGFLIYRPSLKIKYWKVVGGGLDGFTDWALGLPFVPKSTTGLVARYNRIKDAENCGAVLSRGGVLLGIGNASGVEIIFLGCSAASWAT